MTLITTKYPSPPEPPALQSSCYGGSFLLFIFETLVHLKIDTGVLVAGNERLRRTRWYVD